MGQNMDETDAAKILSVISQMQRELWKESENADVLLNGQGPFGLCKTNPVPTHGIQGSKEYLRRLRTLDGFPIEAVRRGSTEAPEVTNGWIDMYIISRNAQRIGMLYLCPYHSKNSAKAPEGFRLGPTEP